MGEDTTVADSSNIIYPNQASDYLIKYLEQLSDPDNHGLDMGIKNIDDYLTPLTPADMMVILARPSHAKTAMLTHYAMRASHMALASRNSKKKYAPPVYITAETPVEELSIKTLSNYINMDSRQIRRGTKSNDWELLKNGAADLETRMPIVYIGHSVINPRRGLITIDYIQNAVYQVTEKFGCPPRVILVDYIQRIATPGISDRRLGLSEVVESLKDLHMSVGSPLIFGSQARREVDDRAFPIPESSDGKETGSIEETADIVISTMRPIKYWDKGKEIPATNPVKICHDNLFFIKVLKQRNGESNNGFWINLDPKVTELSELEEIEINNNGEN